MYHALSPEAGEFFDEMVRHDLLDVTGSPNKISGMGFCDMLGAPYRMPFIFANCDGTPATLPYTPTSWATGSRGICPSAASRWRTMRA